MGRWQEGGAGGPPATGSTSIYRHPRAFAPARGRAAHATLYEVYRTALADKRIVRAGDDARTHGRSADKESGTGARRVRTLAPHIFLQKFLQHVLPAGFTRVRYYGFLAPPAAPSSRRSAPSSGPAPASSAGAPPRGRVGTWPRPTHPAPGRPSAPTANCGRPMELLGTIPRARGPPAFKPNPYHYAQPGIAPLPPAA